MLFNTKLLIKHRIEQIKSKRKLVKIYHILMNDDKVHITENNNGIFLKFNDLNETTYHELLDYVISI